MAKHSNAQTSYFGRIAIVVVAILVSGFIASLNADGGVANQYIGCYYDEDSGSNWTVGFSQSNDLSINGCIGRCRKLNRIYAILQRGKDCLCGDNFNSIISNDLCNVPCSGNSLEYCGGSKMGLQYSIFYTVCPIGRYLGDCSGVCHCKDQIPCDLLTGVCPNGCEGNWTNSNCNEESTFIGRYIGCYKDADPRALPVWDGEKFDDSNPIRWCSRYCALTASTYAGLQASEYCLCGENYSRHGKAEESECTMECSGNRSQICGYHWTNSVYSVCSAGRFGTECLYSCNCRDKEVCNVRSGRCKSGCKPGWTGDSCSVRNCCSNNGDCSANETCVTVNLGYASVSRCDCPSGYGRDTPWDKCRDVDECSLPTSVCDKETETCQNIFGGFTCTCNSGSMYPLSVVIIAAVGSGVGVAIICLLIVFIHSKKKRHEQHGQQCDEDNGIGRRTEDANTDSVTLQDINLYETLNRTTDEDTPVYDQINRATVGK